MGVDYNSRKAAKRHFKKISKGATGDDAGAKRDRKKRQPSTKRLGVCWGEPTVTPEDKQWTDDEDGDDAFDLLSTKARDDDAVDLDAPAKQLESRRKMRLKRTVPMKKPGSAPTPPPAEADPRDEKSAKRERAKLAAADAAAAKVRLSSAVNLLSPTAGAAGGGKGGGGSGKGGGKGASGGGAGAAAGDDGEGAPSGAAGAGDGAAGGQVVVAEALLPYHAVIRTYMSLQKFVEPTEVQSAVWRRACEGANVAAQAQTGSGKTLAFLLPVAARLVDAGHGRHTAPPGPLALVVAPTRELALQTHAAARPLRRLYGLASACVYGGVDKATQAEAMAARPHVLIATPGRLLDLVDDGAVSLAHVQAVCLDECDKMLGLGFAEQLNRLADLLLRRPGAAAEDDPAEAAERTRGRPGEGDGAGVKRASEATAGGEGGGRKAKKARAGDVKLVPAAAPPGDAWTRPQVLLFTATMPPEVGAAADVWLGGADGDVLRVSLKASPLSISPTITQVVQVCAEHKKPAKLLKHLNAIRQAAEGLRAQPRVLVFANRIKTVRFVHNELKTAGFNAVMLHGERSQPEREAAIRDFKAGKAQVLVATDVAARGLHVRNLLYIVNYDFPGNLETYIHRVGRTGRLQAYGHAFSFFTRNLARLAPSLVACLKQNDQAVDPNLVQLAESYALVLEQLGPEGVAKLSGSGVDDDDEEGQPGSEGPADGADDGDDLYADDLTEGLRHAARRPTAPAAAAPRDKRRRDGSAAAPPAAGEGPSAAGLLPAAQPKPKRRFIASAVFTGRRAGYAFRTGASGTGYYLDAPPVVPARGAAKGAGGAAFGGGVDDDAELDRSKRFVKKKAGLLDGDRPAQQVREVAEKKSGGRKKAVPGRLRKKLKQLQDL